MLRREAGVGRFAIRGAARLRRSSEIFRFTLMEERLGNPIADVREASNNPLKWGQAPA